MQRRGFSLLSLLIVICVLTAAACLAVPPMVRTKRLSNEIDAAYMLSMVGRANLTFKTSASKNGEYWTRDVAGLYYAPQVPLIDVSICLADGNNRTIGSGTHLSEPRSGYWVMALSRYEMSADDFDGKPYGEKTDPERFGFIAVPDHYGSSGNFVLILSECGCMYLRNPESNIWTVHPKQGAQYSGGIIDATPGRAYDTFPWSPCSGSRGRCPIFWSRWG